MGGCQRNVVVGVDVICDIIDFFRYVLFKAPPSLSLDWENEQIQGPAR